MKQQNEKQNNMKHEKTKLDTKRNQSNKPTPSKTNLNELKLNKLLHQVTCYIKYSIPTIQCLDTKHILNCVYNGPMFRY